MYLPMHSTAHRDRLIPDCTTVHENIHDWVELSLRQTPHTAALLDCDLQEHTGPIHSSSNHANDNTGITKLTLWFYIARDPLVLSYYLWLLRVVGYDMQPVTNNTIVKIRKINTFALKHWEHIVASFQLPDVHNKLRLTLKLSFSRTENGWWHHVWLDILIISLMLSSFNVILLCCLSDCQWHNIGRFTQLIAFLCWQSGFTITITI